MSKNITPITYVTHISNMKDCGRAVFINNVQFTYIIYNIMTKHIKKIALQQIPKNAKTLPMIAMLAALGVSSLTYSVTVSADTATSTRITGMHIQKGKKVSGDKVDHREKPAVAGVIQSIDGSRITVKDREGKLYTVDVGAATILKGGRGQAPISIQAADLVLGDMFGAKGVLTGTHVVATQGMTSPQHSFMKKLHEKRAKRT